MKQKQNKVGTGVVSQANPVPAPDKPFYADDPRYVYISLKADPSEVAAYLQKYGNNDAMVDLKREHPHMVFTSQDTTKNAANVIAKLPILKGA